MSTRFAIGSALTLAVAAMGLGLALGCTPQTSANAVLGGQIQSALGSIPNPVNLRVINQTNSDLELDLLIDGSPLRVSCPVILGVCDQPLLPCPETVEAVQQRTLDAQGRFTGGRNFNSTPAFTFTGDEISCGSVIVYQFTDTTATAFAL